MNFPCWCFHDDDSPMVPPAATEAGQWSTGESGGKGLYLKGLQQQAGYGDILAGAGRVCIELAPEGAESEWNINLDERIYQSEAHFCSKVLPDEGLRRAC